MQASAASPLSVRDLFANGTGIAREPDGRVQKLSPGAAIHDQVRLHGDPGGWRLLEASSFRTTPRCPLFSRCAGCTVQHLSRAGQSEWKRSWVRESLRRIGGQAQVEVEPVLQPSAAYGYRNKLVLTFGGNPLVLGYRDAGGGAGVLPVAHCHLAPPWMAWAAKIVLQACRRAGQTAWAPGKPGGFWRKLVLREGKATGQRLMVLLTSSSPNRPVLDKMRYELQGLLDGHVHTFLHGTSSRGKDTDQSDSSVPWWGSGGVEERLLDLRFRVSPNSFFQVNSPGAEALASLCLDWANVRPGSRWLDLFCGAGTFTLPLAVRGAEALGVDFNEDAIRDARANALANRLTRVRFESMDLQKEARRLLSDFKPEGVWVDPPRSGLPPWLGLALKDCSATRMLYVSCDPASLARDSAILTGPGGWRLARVCPVDLFPQTGHVETVALFERA